MTFLRTLFLARVPVFFLLAVGLLALLSLGGPVAPVLQGLFTLEDWDSLARVSLAAFLLGLGGTSSINLILEHGRERMDTELGLSTSYHPYHPLISTYLVCMITPVGFVAACAGWSSLGLWASATAILTGFALAHGFIFGAVAVELWYSEPGATPPNMLILPLPRRLIDGLNNLPAPGENGLRDSLNGLAGIFCDYARPLLRGYSYLSNGQCRFYPGIIFNGAFFAIALIVWISSIHNSQPNRPVDQPGSLAFVLIAFLVLMLLLSGLAYFLDRYRIPMSLVILLYAFVVGGSNGNDHLYRVCKTKVRLAYYAHPSDVLARRGQRAVIVMTAGGGIQSAAWTTRVLAGLEQAAGKGFPKQIALISSVSGGSLGAYYIAVANHNGATFEQAAQWALQPALDQVAWGWMGPDLFRVFSPYAFERTIDRGWALETTWDRITKTQDFFVDQLAQDIRDKNAPGFVFNGSVIEEGSPFVISNTEFPRCNRRAELRGVKEFNDVYQHSVRVRVSTAARLSASFPYVAPAARSDAHPLRPDYHIVDGGYYDNFGIRSAIDWLDQAVFDEAADLPQKVALIHIRWGDKQDSGGSMQGWNYQVSAPVSAILNIRDKEQLREDRVALETFLSRFPKDRVEQFEFVYTGQGDCAHQPNSWKFTPRQAACVSETWGAHAKEAARVREFLQ